MYFPTSYETRFVGIKISFGLGAANAVAVRNFSKEIGFAFTLRLKARAAFQAQRELHDLDMSLLGELSRA
jgi:hypothetical protein